MLQIVNDNALGKLPLKVVVPITDWKDRYNIAPWIVQLIPNTKNGLSKESAADCFQVRSLSQDRLIKKLGFIHAELLEEVKSLSKECFRYDFISYKSSWFRYCCSDRFVNSEHFM